MSAGGPRPKQLVFISEKDRLLEAESKSCKGKTPETERVRSLQITLSSGLHLSQVQQDLWIKNQILQPSTGMQELTINLSHRQGIT